VSKTVLPLESFIINFYFVILYIYVDSDQKALCPLRGLARFPFPVPFLFVFPVAVCFCHHFDHTVHFLIVVRSPTCRDILLCLDLLFSPSAALANFY